MFEKLPSFGKGGHVGAGDMNAISQRVSRLTTGPVVYTPPGGELPPMLPYLFLDLYELTSEPTLDDVAREYKALAKLVLQQWCAVDEDGHYVRDENRGVAGTVPRARRQEIAVAAATVEQAVWFVTTARDSNQEPSSPPGLKSGDRVLVTTWGRDTTEEEFAVKIVVGGGGGSPLRPIEMKTTCLPNNATAARGWPVTWNAETLDYDAPDYEDETSLIDVYERGGIVMVAGYDDVSGDVRTGRGDIVYVDSNGTIVSGGRSHGAATMTDNLTPNGSAGGHLRVVGSGGTLVPTEIDLLLQDDLLAGDQRVYAGLRVFWIIIDGGFFVTQAQCP